MKLYVAAPWVDKALIPEIATKFEKAGHRITHKWWFMVEENNREDWQLRGCAEADARGVKEADVVIVINTSKSEGKAIEQGIAIALGKPIVAVGERGVVSHNVFHYMNCYIWVNTIEEAIDVIRVGKVFYNQQPL